MQIFDYLFFILGGIMIIVDGKCYETDSEAPDLGSWECVSTEANGARNYQGLSKDISKLPTAQKYAQYNTLAAGSTAMCVDTGDIIFYSKSNDTWYVQ